MELSSWLAVRRKWVCLVRLIESSPQLGQSREAQHYIEQRLVNRMLLEQSGQHWGFEAGTLDSKFDDKSRAPLNWHSGAPLNWLDKFAVISQEHRSTDLDKFAIISQEHRSIDIVDPGAPLDWLVGPGAPLNWLDHLLSKVPLRVEIFNGGSSAWTCIESDHIFDNSRQITYPWGKGVGISSPGAMHSDNWSLLTRSESMKWS